jgi:hypothetical protein
VFKRIAEQVLSYLDVPRDVPLSPRLQQAAYKKQVDEDGSSLEDFVPADFSATPDPLPAETSPTKVPRTSEQTPSVTVAVDQGGDIDVPNFSGKTMREVTESCLRLGLDPVPVGSGLATNQMPAPGARVRRGMKVTVQFGTQTSKTTKHYYGNRN